MSVDIYPGNSVPVSCTLSIPYIKVHEWVSDITTWIVRRPQVGGIIYALLCELLFLGTSP